MNDTEVFRVCRDFWNILASGLFQTNRGIENFVVAAINVMVSQVSVMPPGMVNGQPLQRRQLYASYMFKLRMLTICHIVLCNEIYLGFHGTKMGKQILGFGHS